MVRLSSLLGLLFNAHNPVGLKRNHTLVAKSRACSSRCCGLSSVVYHGWEGKKRGHSNWRKLLSHSASLTGKVNKKNILYIKKLHSENNILLFPKKEKAIAEILYMLYILSFQIIYAITSII